VARESSNGGDPASQPSKNGSAPDADDDTGTAFERFERLTQKLVNTPKSEVDERLERAKREKRATSSRS
jgi:hypothetical protein